MPSSVAVTSTDVCVAMLGTAVSVIRYQSSWRASGTTTDNRDTREGVNSKFASSYIQPGYKVILKAALREPVIKQNTAVTLRAGYAWCNFDIGRVFAVKALNVRGKH